MIKLNDQIVDVYHFPDGTLLLKEKIADKYISSGVCIDWNFESNEELITLVYLTKHLRDNCVRNIWLKMPYIPNSRMDRVKHSRDVFTLKYFADIINSLNFNCVEVLDPHSPVSEALINNIIVNNGKCYIDKVLKNLKDVIIYYPDNGAYKKYSDFIKLPSCYGVKNRDWETGEILGLDLITNGVDIKSKTILMVDDIISYGGSMYYGAKKLKELGCGDIYIYASHVENSILDGDLIKSGLFEKIFTTNSLFTGKHEKIEVFEV